MKRLFFALTALLVLAGAVVAYRAGDACADWQERYKRFLYSEMFKNSPIIYTPGMIEDVVGEPPSGCDRPSPVLSEADKERYAREGVGPNEFK